MAARLGEDGNRQTLAQFVTSSPWDAAHVQQEHLLFRRWALP